MTNRFLDEFAGVASEWFWETDADLRFTFFSDRFAELTGIDPADARGRTWTEIAVEPDDMAIWRSHMADFAARRPIQGLVIAFAHRDGRIRWLRISGRPYLDERGGFAGYRGTGTDVTAERVATDELARLNAELLNINATLEMQNARLEETNRRLSEEVDQRRRLEDELRRLATTDPLTGAFNRRIFHERTEEEFSRARRHGRLPALIVLDVDRFKRINDDFGHDAGDRVLVDLVRSLGAMVRGPDTLARIGGEEFAVLLPETRLPEAIRIGERIRASTEDLAVPVGGGQVGITVSAGVAAFEDTDPDPATALRRADEMLYAAKRLGRNRVHPQPI